MDLIHTTGPLGKTPLGGSSKSCNNMCGIGYSVVGPLNVIMRVQFHSHSGSANLVIYCIVNTYLEFEGFTKVLLLS